MSSFTREPTGVGRGAPATVVARWLHDLEHVDVGEIGAKASNLVRAATHGFPVVPGFVIATGQAAALRHDGLDALRPAWLELSDGGRWPVVVRSSSPVEDDAASSMAGVFHSVVGVADWPGFRAAFEAVVDSARGHPMAVLVQRHLDPATSGVLFGVDPVSGRSDRRVVAAVAGGPWRLVSGEVTGRRTVLDRSGRAVASDGDPQPVLGRRALRRLARLAEDAAARFGGPQDIEWALDHETTLWVLQARPVTAVARRGDPSGPRLGPGPVAETFPDPLTPLEADLWVPPLRQAIVHALDVAGVVPARRIRRSPVVRLVQRRAVVDLDLIEGAPRRGLWRRLDPRPSLRRLASAWRTGRIRAAFPGLVSQVLADADTALAAVPPLDELTDDEALRVLDNVRRHLVALHGHELLAARLGRSDGAGAAELALAALEEGRRRGWSDDDVVARSPVVLALLPPRIDAAPPLPDARHIRTPVGAALSDREALRLRVRWLHELSARTSLELGERLVARGVLTSATQVNGFELADLADVVHGWLTPVNPAEPDRSAPPLPAAFRLGSGDEIIAEHAGTDGALGASPGRAAGPVSHGDPADGDVLVVRTLDPALAAVLPRLTGLIAETGSPLSHLAILAREYGVPTVVGVADACRRFAPGQHVVVDGTNGEVTVIEEVTTA